MSTFLPTLVSWLQEFGYPILWGCAFLSAIGTPLPTVLLLLAAGAFAEVGDFNIFVLALVATSASVCGDGLGYAIGRWVGRRALIWLVQQKRFWFIPSKTLIQSQRYFQRRGGWAIFLSRFLVIALGGPINLLAGAEEYSYPRFLTYDISGQTLGAVIPLLLGYTFGASWEIIGTILGAISGFVLAVFCAVFFSIRLVAVVKKAGESKRCVLNEDEKVQAASQEPLENIEGNSLLL